MMNPIIFLFFVLKIINFNGGENNDEKSKGNHWENDR